MAGSVAAVPQAPRRPHPFSVRATVVFAVLAGLFGMHGLGAGHPVMTIGGPATSSHAMAGLLLPTPVPVPVLPGPIVRTGGTGVALVSVLSGQSGAGSAQHTGMTSMTCVAVLTGAAAAAVPTLPVFRRALARRRARPSWPAPVHVIARRVTQRVVVLPRALSLSQLCVMRV